MYSRSFQEGDYVDYYRLLEGVTEDGEVVAIPKESLDLHLWHYRDLVRDLENGREDAFIYLWQKLPSGSEFRELRVMSFPVAVTKNGPVEHGSILLSTIPVADKFRGAQ
jgi:hypothetical protein